MTYSVPPSVVTYTRWPSGAAIRLNPSLLSGTVVTSVFEATSTTAKARPDCRVAYAVVPAGLKTTWGGVDPTATLLVKALEVRSPRAKVVLPINAA
jgi:hypothetical protein